MINKYPPDEYLVGRVNFTVKVLREPTFFVLTETDSICTTAGRLQSTVRPSSTWSMTLYVDVIVFTAKDWVSAIVFGLLISNILSLKVLKAGISCNTLSVKVVEVVWVT